MFELRLVCRHHRSYRTEVLLLGTTLSQESYELAAPQALSRYRREATTAYRSVRWRHCAFEGEWS